MSYEIIQRETDNYKKFYVTERVTDDVTKRFEIPCILNEDNSVNVTETQTAMTNFIAEHDLIMSYIGE